MLYTGYGGRRNLCHPDYLSLINKDDEKARDEEREALYQFLLPIAD